MMSGQVAYEAYFHFSGGRSLITGQPLPQWGQQSVDIRAAWEAAGLAAEAHGSEEVHLKRIRRRQVMTQTIVKILLLVALFGGMFGLAWWLDYGRGPR